MKNPQAFGRYTLYFEPLSLFAGNRAIALPRRQMEVLALIVERRGVPVSREEFLRVVWQGSYIEDGNLTQAIFLLRRTLGKLPNGAEFIETVPRVGYRLSPDAIPPAQQTEATAQSNLPILRSVLEPAERPERFRLLVDSIEEYAIYMLDCAGRVLTWNLGAEKSTGYSPLEVLGKPFSILFLAEDIQAHAPDRELWKATRLDRCAGEGWRLKKSGERFWASFVMTPMCGPGGKLLGFSKVVHDLTDKKRQEDMRRTAEAILRLEHDRLYAALEGSVDAFYICEPLRAENGEIKDFLVTYFNHALETLLSLPREKLLGARISELFPAPSCQQLFDEYLRATLTGKPYIAELTIRPTELGTKRVRLQAVPLENGIAVTATDITDMNHRSPSSSIKPNRTPDR